MPDNETQPQPAAAPQIDMDALAARLQQAAAQGTAQAIERVANQNTQAQARERAAAATQADPIAQTVLPVVAPALRELAVKADSGRDAAVFYATTPAASLWNLIRGENLDKFVTDAIAQRDADVKAAQEATTVRGNRGGAPAQQVREASSMSREELEKSLENVAF